MAAPDKPLRDRAGSTHAHCEGWRLLAFGALALASLSSCNRMVTPPAKQVLKDADAKIADGDFIQAINLYEGALDGSANSADIHYRMALLYDDKMSDPLNAMHHFKRYLTLAPSGSHATEVKNFMKRDELTLVTTLSGDSVVTRAEGARLKNENLALRKQLDDQAAHSKIVAANEKLAASSGKHAKGGPRAHVVKSGETLYSLARKYYHSQSRWKEIRDANKDSLDGDGKLKVGQTVTIP